MATLVTSIWLISALLAYFLDGIAVNCCDTHQWTTRNREAIAVWCLLLGPFALVIALEVLLLAEMAEGLSHRRRCRRCR